tara:strand:- start:282 stop:740 length:459 start_codon:yes stop_codon:yes gene_type:complete
VGLIGAGLKLAIGMTLSNQGNEHGNSIFGDGNSQRFYIEKIAQVSPSPAIELGRVSRGNRIGAPLCITKEIPVTDKQINVPSENINYLLNMVENRILEIGVTYEKNGRSYQDDLEISALRAIARQLGFDFEVLSSIKGSGFDVTRYVHTQVD